MIINSKNKDEEQEAEPPAKRSLGKTPSDPMSALGDRGALTHVKKSLGVAGGSAGLSSAKKGRAKAKAAPGTEVSAADRVKHLLK